MGTGSHGEEIVGTAKREALERILIFSRDFEIGNPIQKLETPISALITGSRKKNALKKSQVPIRKSRRKEKVERKKTTTTGILASLPPRSP